MHWLRLWFGLDGKVDQKLYLGSGLFLMALKYGVDLLISKASGGSFINPLTYLNPLLTVRMQALGLDQDSMEEWSPWNVVHAPHLVGTMQSRRGQFEIIELGSGSTRLVGTTWYTLDLAPGAYWRFFSDAIVHRIHGRVLRHIKSLSEA